VTPVLTVAEVNTMEVISEKEKARQLGEEKEKDDKEEEGQEGKTAKSKATEDDDGDLDETRACETSPDGRSVLLTHILGF